MEADRQLVRLALLGHQGQRELLQIDCIADGGCLLDLLHAWLLRRESRPVLLRRWAGQGWTARASGSAKMLGLHKSCMLSSSTSSQCREQGSSMVDGGNFLVTESCYDRTMTTGRCEMQQAVCAMPCFS